MCQDTATLVVTIVELGEKTKTTTVTVASAESPLRAVAVVETALKYSSPPPQSLLVISVSLICPKCANIDISHTLCWKVETGRGIEGWQEEFAALDCSLQAALRTV